MTLVVIVIVVMSDMQAGVMKDGRMVAPGRIGNINVMVAELCQELTHDTETTCSGQTLDASNSILLKRYRVLTIGEFESQVDKLGVSGLWKIQQ